MPEVLAAETRPVPAQSLRGDGLLTGPLTPAVHGRRSEARRAGQQSRLHTHRGQLPYFICLEECFYDTLICAVLKEEKLNIYWL